MTATDPRVEAEPVLRPFTEALRGSAIGLYVGGSLASGGYRPGVSDIDGVALLERPLSRAARARLIEVHRALVTRDPRAAVVHCVYIPREGAADLGRAHWTWAFGGLFRRPLSGIARAELVGDPVVPFGPSPRSWLPPMDADAVRAAARAELSGYWATTVRRRRI